MVKGWDRNAIIVAVISVVGVITAAVIGNWDRMFLEDREKEQATISDPLEADLEEAAKAMNDNLQSLNMGRRTQLYRAIARERTLIYVFRLPRADYHPETAVDLRGDVTDVVCTTEDLLRLVELGASLRYIYVDQNWTKVADVTVSRC